MRFRGHLPPGLSSLVYRSKRDGNEGNSDSRPHPSAQDKVLASHFETLNAVGDGCCWMTGVGDAERVHILPHAEKDCTRLILWLQLMELVPMTIHERAKWKVSYENLLPLQHSIHRHLTDGDQSRAILRPTREDLLLLVRVLEEGLQREDEQDFSSAWRPRWEEMISSGWPRKESFGKLCLPTYEFQLDIFNLKPLTIFKVKKPAGPAMVSRVTGDEFYPNVLEPQLDNLQAPLSILTVVAVAVSQASSISLTAGRKYGAAFLEELDIMSYVVNLLGSPTPSYFRGLQRPSALPPLPPLPQPASPSSPQRMREWPLTKPRTRSSAAAPPLPKFSSSSPKGYKDCLAPELYEMQRAQIADEEASASTDGEHEDSKCNGGARSSRGREPEPQGDESRSSGGDSSMNSSDLSSISVLSPPPGLQDAKDATAVSMVAEQAQAQGQGQGQLERSLAAGRGPDSVASSVALWHEEAQSLDDKQDLLLDDSLSALADQMQALSNDADSSRAPAQLFDFLVSAEPLDITSRLQAIEQRREEMLEQWEDGLG